MFSLILYVYILPTQITRKIRQTPNEMHSIHCLTSTLKKCQDIENKGRVRNCHRLAETKIPQLNEMGYWGLNYGH